MKSLGTLVLFFFGLVLSLKVNAQKETFNLSDSIFEVGQVYKSYEIRFPVGGYDILEYSYPFLDSIASFLLLNETLIVEIGQHRDCRGVDVSSQRFTPKRAKEIANYLILKGIDETRLIDIGFGEIEPNIVYVENENILFFKPNEEQNFETITLTESFINQYKLSDRELFERLHQHNRRTEFKIVGFLED